VTKVRRSSARRVSFALVAALVGCLLVPQSASGWSNGSGGYNSFGTHDWILQLAIETAGNEARWVKVRVALRATDDPDSKDGIDHASGTWWHVHNVWGSRYGGAPEAAQVWFRRTRRRLQASQTRRASKALGYLAHIVGDVAQPMHTDSSDRETDSVHSGYEQAVDSRIGRYRFRHDGRDAAKPYRRTVKAAGRAHTYYRDLLRLRQQGLQPQGPSHHEATTEARRERRGRPHHVSAIRSSSRAQVRAWLRRHARPISQKRVSRSHRREAWAHVA
jgi:hypothetical protein